MNFVHIGGGAGDQDPSSDYRDGFSEYVKNHKCKIKNIFVVEANPKNIKKLKLTWKKYKNIKILNYAIIPNNSKKKKIKLYYSEEDAPHYQLLSNKTLHIKRYFPHSKIKFLLANTLKINTFFYKYFKNKIIDSFSIDIEGADFDIFMDIDLKKYVIKKISIEYLHLNKKQKKIIIKKMIENGYSYTGFGLDHKNIDWMFEKKKLRWNNFIVKIFPYIHRIYYKRLNKFLNNI